MSSHRDNAFSTEDRRALLGLARSAILSAFEGSSARFAGPEPPCFSWHRGVFVTVHVGGKLRGCIGVIEGREPLRQSIAHCADGAAFHDPRFPSVRPEEVESLRIEISVLSALAPIEPDAVEIGRDGLLVVSGDYRGLLLPQVATEHGLSREEFLEETCRKAGLPRDAWRKKETRIYGFTCEIFGDAEQQRQAGSK